MAILSNINDKFAVDSTGAIQFNGQVGTSGYILKSNGNTAPTWVDPDDVIGGPYLPLTGGTLTGNLAISGSNSLTVGGALTANGLISLNNTINVNGGNAMQWYASSTNAKMNMDARVSGTGVRIHKWNRNANNDAYLPYYENWYDGNSYHSIGVEGNVWRLSDGLEVNGNTVIGFSGSWNGANMPGSRWNGYDVNGGEVVFQRDNPSSGRMSMLVDGQYYAGENGGFYSLYSGNDYNNRRGFNADSNGVLQFNGDVQAPGLYVGSRNASFDFYNNGTSYFNDVVTIDAEFIQSSGLTSSFSGDINQYGSIFRTSSFINLLNNRNTKKYLNTPYFTNGDSNQAVNIQFPNVALQGYYKITLLQGYYKITLSGSYSHQDISGKLTKVIPFGYNPNGSIWRTGSSQSEITIATGGVSTNFTIGNLAWDSTNSKFIIPIYKLTSSGNSVKILIEYFGGAANNLSDVTLSAKYTQTAPSPFNVRQYQYIQDRLGIGTISPSAKLNVVDGASTIVSVDTHGYARFTQQNGSAQVGLFRSGGSAGGGYIGADSGTCFHVRDASFGTKLYLTQTGNLGIGTTNPSCGTIGGTPLLHAYNNTNGAKPTIHVSCHDYDEAALLLSENSGGGGNWGARLYYEGSGALW